MPDASPAPLTDQVAIVTGASRGIGKGIAQTLAQAGAKVICVARSLDKLNETVEAIRSAGGTAEAMECDVCDSASVEKLLETVSEKHGQIHILINNAGINRDNLLLRMGDDEWDDVMTTNLKGMFVFTRAASKLMSSKRYGRIVNVTSVVGFMGNPGQANYAASKAGMIGFTRTVAKELGKRNITCNAVAPGLIETDMSDALPEIVREEFKKKVPCKRLGTVDEIADAVLFLVRPASAYVNGITLTVDGGLTA